MKFGRNLPRHQVPEWSSHYINYKGLKKLINSTAETVRAGGNANLAEFFYSLDRNLEDVDSFYNKKLADSSRRLKVLEDRYGRSEELPPSLFLDEAQELMTALVDLRNQFTKLHWYAEVNRRGFIKITKKLDKKIPGVRTQSRYLESKVEPKAFASNEVLDMLMTLVNDWLLKLEIACLTERDGSSTPSRSITQVSWRAPLSIPEDVLAEIDAAICNDDTADLSGLLAQYGGQFKDESSGDFLGMRLSLLQRSISCRARMCVDMLLGQVDSLDGPDDINSRNCIHRLVIAASCPYLSAQNDSARTETVGLSVDLINGILPVAASTSTSGIGAVKEQEGKDSDLVDEELSTFLRYVLGKLRTHQRTALLAKDSQGRTPLHYAAQGGLSRVCHVIIQVMQQWGLYDVTGGVDATNWQDAEGCAPLHLSAMAGYPVTTELLLRSEGLKDSPESSTGLPIRVRQTNTLLSLATKQNFATILRLLVQAGADINYQDEQGESALHVAARFGRAEITRSLLEGTLYQKADTELAEKTFAWTPLFVASVEGHLGVVQLLIDAGAQLNKLDLSGWTAKEHAALRGHIKIARLLPPMSPFDTANSTPSTALSVSPPSTPGSDDRISQAMTSANGGARAPEPVKTFGHRYLTDESLVLVTLGTMDSRKSVEPVRLDRSPSTHVRSTQLDRALSIVVSATGAKGEPYVIDLPVQDNICTEPIAFTTPDASQVKLIFDIVPTYTGAKDHIVARGAALLSSVKPQVGSNKAALLGDVSIPLLAASDLDVIGSVHFNFLVIKPFKHPNISIAENKTYWKSMSSPMLIGHRGLGKNQPSMNSLQLGENTIQSFIAAANLGASYVEFDVQLTKDNVPVIYHDFLVAETGIDAPVHTLTLEQFLHVGNEKSPLSSRPPSPVRNNFNGDARPNGSECRRPRASSTGNLGLGSVGEMKERMKHTRAMKQKGFKGNRRGDCIQAPFTTLEEMFKKLPESIGFNIEMKYPMLFESEEHEMDTYAVELNSFVDAVLTKVYDLGQKRNIIFSSFNPDVCLLLSFKQPSIPILFLTDAGVDPAGDIRATSLQEAIRFAARWNLLGIVSAAEPLVMCPRLVRVVKESGLVCVSYGTLNNDPDNVELQVKEGIDAVIVDNVLAIRKGLTSSKSRTAAVNGGLT